MDNIKIEPRKWSAMLCFFAVLLMSFSAVIGQDRPDLPELKQQARGLGVAEARIAELERRAGSAGISEADLAEILQRAIDLARADLPEDLILQKALEGMSKRVPPPQLLQVLGNLQQQTVEASKLVDPWLQRDAVQAALGGGRSQADLQGFRNRLIETSAKVLGQGLSAGFLQSILDDVSDPAILKNINTSNLIAGIAVLPDLSGTSQQPEFSRTLVVRALRGGFAASDLQKLPNAMAIAQMRSQLPASAVIEGISKQLEGGIPANEIIQNLFDGNVGGPPGNIPRGLDNRPGRNGG